MDQLTSTEYQKDIIFPPANFEIWPLTRTGALAIDAVVLVVAVLLWVIPRVVYRAERFEDGSQVGYN